MFRVALTSIVQKPRSLVRNIYSFKAQNGCISQFECPSNSSTLNSHYVYTKSMAFKFSTLKNESKLTFQYPKSRRMNLVENLHGEMIADPYRWLEDSESEETKKWVQEQAKFSEGILSNCSASDVFYDDLKKMDNFPKFYSPFRRGSNYFFWKNDGLQNQSVLYIQQTLTSEAQVFLDPNKLSEDGTASIGVYQISENGKYLAYGVNRSGSDWTTIHVIEIESRKQLKDEINWCKFSSIAWSHDEKGFFYTKYPKPRAFDNPNIKIGTETEQVIDQKVFYHKVGTSESEDELIFQVVDHPEFLYAVEVSDDGLRLLITISRNTELVNKLYYIDLTTNQRSTKDENGCLVPTKLIDNWNAMYKFLTNDGDLFYFQTNLNAPRGRIISLNVKTQELKEIIPQSQNVLQNACCVNRQLLVSYMEDVKEVLKLYNKQGKLIRDLKLPTMGSVYASGKWNQTEFFYWFTSFYHAGSIYHYDFEKGGEEATLFKEPKVPGLDTSLFKTEQIFFTSKDGTKVPMFVISLKTLKLDGTNPCLLYGYGGFNISLTPFFTASQMLWVKHFNGIMVVANLRGGNEYGEEWHKAGTLEKKQNVFDDFFAAAECLIKNKYTNPSKLAIMGGSNGGLLVTACINQRPDLFGAAVAQVPLADMLRFHKFTIGYAWCSEYGNPDKKEDFQYLKKYSPVHTVPNDKEFPALLITTGDHDDRAVPLHSFKYLAEVQHKVGSKPFQRKPLIARIEIKGGHGLGKPTDKALREIADSYAFIAQYLDVKYRN